MFCICLVDIFMSLKSVILFFFNLNLNPHLRMWIRYIWGRLVIIDVSDQVAIFTFLYRGLESNVNSILRIKLKHLNSKTKMNRHKAMQIMLQLKNKVRQWNKHELKWLNVDLVRFLLVSKMQNVLTKDRCRTTGYFKWQCQSLFYDTVRTKQKRQSNDHLCKMVTKYDFFLLCLTPLSAMFQLYHGHQF